MANPGAMGSYNFRMDHTIKEDGKLGSTTVPEHMNLGLVLSLMGSGKMDSITAKVHSHGQMDLHTPGSGGAVRRMDLEYLEELMVSSMKANGRMDDMTVKGN